MKKIKKIFISIISLFAIFGIALVGSSAKSPKQIEAASQAKFEYKTYLKSDYEEYKTKCITLEEDLTTVIGWDSFYETIPSSVSTSNLEITVTWNNINTIYPNYDKSYIEDVWAQADPEDILECTGDESKSCLEFYGKTVSEYMENTSILITYKVQRKVIKFDSYELVDFSIPSLDETTSFNPGDQMVIETYLLWPDYYYSVQAAFDPKMESNMGKPLSSSNNGVYYVNKNIWDGAISKSMSTSIQGVSGHKNCFVVGGYVTIDSSTDNRFKSDEMVMVGALGLDIDSDANGTYNISVVKGNQTIVMNNNISSINAKDDSSMFDVGSKTITVAGQSTTATIDPDSVKVNNTSPTKTETITGSTLSGKTQFVFDDIDAETAKLTAAAAERGTITSVKYASTIDGALNGTNVTEIGGSYDIPTGNPGDTVYAVITVKAQTGGATEQYVVKITRKMDSTAELSGLTIQTKDSSKDINFKLLDDSGAETTFNKENTKYKIQVSESVMSIDFTAVFNPGMTCTIDGNTVTSNVLKNINVSSKLSVTIKVTSQDGKNSKEYTFEIEKLSDDVSLGSVNVKVDGTAEIPSVSGTIYTVNDVDYVKTGFTISATNDHNAKIEIDGVVTASGYESKIFEFGLGIAEIKKSVTIKVTSESGLVTETYTVEVTRNAADTNNEKNTFTLYGNNGNVIAGTWSGDTFTASNPVSYEATGIYINATAQSSVATAKFNNASYTLGANSSTVNFTSSNSLSLTLVITSQSGSDKTYTINVKRAEADDTYEFEYEFTYGSNVTINVNKSGDTYTSVSNLPTTVTEVYLKVKPKKSSTTAWIGGTNYTNTTYTATIKLVDVNGAIQNPQTTIIIIFKTQAQQNHEVKFIVKSDTLSDNADISGLTIVGANDNQEYGPTSTADNNYVYQIKKSSAGTQFKLTINGLHSKATVRITNNPSEDSITNGQAYYAGMLLDIETKYYIVVFAESKVTKRKYSLDVKFTDERDTNNNISSITADIELRNALGDLFVFDKSKQAQGTYIVPYSVKQIEFNVVLESTKASLYQGVNGIVNLKVGTNTFIYQAQAENETKGTSYTIIIERQTAKTDANIESITVNTNAVVFNSDAKGVYLLDSDKGIFAADFVITVSTGATFTATYSYNGNTYSKAENFSINSLTKGKYVTITILVKSEKNTIDGNPDVNAYTLYLICASNKSDVSSIEILEDDEFGSELNNTNGKTFEFNKDTKNIPFTIAYSAKNPYIVVESEDANATITGNGFVSVGKGKNDVIVQKNITVSSQYKTILTSLGLTDTNASETVYNFKFTRLAGNSDNTLKELVVKINGVDKNLSIKDINTIEDLGQDLTSVTVIATPNASTSTVSGDIGDVNVTFVSNIATQTLRITVTPEVGDAKTYTIILAATKAELDTDNKITNITVDGAIDGVHYLSNFSSGTQTYNITTMRASAKAANITVTTNKNTSKVEIKVDSSDPEEVKTKRIELVAGTTVTVTITCYAQDGTKGTPYTINIKVPADSTDNTLSNIKVNGTNIGSFLTDGATFDPANDRYTINVKNDVENIKLEPNKNDKYSEIISNDAAEDTQLNIGKNQFIISVKAEDGIQKNYIIDVYRDAPTRLESLEVETDDKILTLSPEFTSETFTYNAEDIAYKYDSVTVTATVPNDYKTHLTVTITGNTNLVADKNNKVTITVTANSGASQEYIVNVKRLKGNDDNSIRSYTDNGVTLEPVELSQLNSEYKFTYKIERDTDPTKTFNPTIEVAENATITLPQINTINPGKNIFIVTVTSETEKSQKYTFTVYYVDTNFTIDGIAVKENASGNSLKDENGNSVEFEQTRTNYSYKVPYSQTSAYIFVQTSSSNAKVYLNDTLMTSGTIKALNEGVNTFKVYAISEYGGYNPTALDIKSSVYTITITREEADTDATLKDLQVIVNGENKLVNFDPDTYEYTITNVDATSIEIKGELKENSKAQILSGTGIKSVTHDAQEFIVVVQAENKDKKQYKIIILKGDVRLDEDNKITYIEVMVDGKLYLGNTSEDGTEQFSQSKERYSYTIPFGTKSITIQGFNNNTLVTISPKHIINLNDSSSLWGTTKEYDVQATSQKGEKGTKYTIELTFEQGDKDTTLEYLKVNGVLIEGFNKETRNYTLDAVINSVLDLQISAKPTKSTSSILNDSSFVNFKPSEIDNSVTFKFDLVEGVNVITINVKAQSGDTLAYTISITRAKAKPMLDYIKVDGSNLYDVNNKPVTKFDPNVQVYRAILPYSVGTEDNNGTANIRVSISNKNYIVSCTQTVRDNDASNDAVIVFKHSTLQAGKDNEVTITVTEGAEENVYTLIIRRKAKPSTDASITDITIKDTKDEFIYTPTNNNYSITVPNKVNDLDITTIPTFGKNEDSDGAKVTYVNDKNLLIGENKVLVIVTAEDGQTQKVVEITVIREKMDYSINTSATSYECSLDDTATNKATINLGSHSSNAISDYTKYINNNGNDHLQVTVINQDAVSKGNAREVMLQICDGTNMEYVTLTLLTASNTEVSWIAWILLIIALIILIIILSSVMKDKYGSISKSRKKLD